MTDDELRQLIESNARAIEANSEQARRTDAKLEEMAEQSRRTDAKIDRLADIVTGNRQDITANRQDIDAAERQLRASIDDTVAMIADLARQQQETDQRFTIFLEESRRDRQRSEERAAANDTEHRAFQQITQTMLAEISRIWQRIAG
ncbi:hypothetical protein C7271_12470 [filamentous cyanobacterium CCP5]|nr:hypothetical protein C7271_12470 [filamentous cyanobacterium CCP5]